MKKNKIGWCHTTKNPIVGCTFSCSWDEGSCYAARETRRATIMQAALHLKRMKLPYKHLSPEARLELFKKTPVWCQDCYTFTPHLHLKRLAQITPRQKPMRVFVGSVADIADFVDMEVSLKDIPPPIPDYLILPFFAAKTLGDNSLRVDEVLSHQFAECKQHTFIILTKRPNKLKGITFPSNTWIGVSITQQTEQGRFHSLVQTNCSPAGNYFVSIEPMLSPINWEITHIPRWVVIGGLSRPGKQPLRPTHTSLTFITRFFRDRNIPVYTKENAIISSQLTFHEFPHTMPVYQGEGVVR